MNTSKLQVRTPEPRVIRAGCYLRISSDPDDKREGVDRQREDTATLCEVKDWQVAGYYEDNDRSASNGKKRPEWERLLGDIRDNKIDAIAAWDQDRGWRMMSELETLRAFFTSLGRPVALATTGQGDVDLFTPTGVMTAQIKTAVSEHEVAMMRVRLKRAGRGKARRGLPQWNSAFGFKPYVRAPGEKDVGVREIDPKAARMLRTAYKSVIDGKREPHRIITSIAEQWNAKGQKTPTGKPWTPSLVSQLLRKPRNAGLREHNDVLVTDPETGQAVRGTWPAIVSEETWRRAVAILDARPGASQRRPMRRHLLTGLLQCGNTNLSPKMRTKLDREECGGYLSGMRTLDDKLVYRCKQCLGVAIRAEDVEPLVFQVVSGRLADSDVKDLMRGDLHDAAQAEELAAEEAELHQRLATIRMERAKGLIDGHDFAAIKEHIDADMKVITAKYRDQGRLKEFDDIPVGEPDVADKLAALPPDRYRAVVDLLFTITVAPVGRGSHNRVFNPERVHFDWKE